MTLTGLKMPFHSENREKPMTLTGLIMPSNFYRLKQTFASESHKSQKIQKTFESHQFHDDLKTFFFSVSNELSVR